MNKKYLYSLFLLFLVAVPIKSFSQEEAKVAGAGLTALYHVLKEKTSDMMTSSPVTTFGVGVLAGGACLYFGMKKLGILGKAPNGYVTQRDFNSFRREITQQISQLPVAINERVITSFSSQVGDFRQVVGELRKLITDLEQRIGKLESLLDKTSVALEKDLQLVKQQYEVILTGQRDNQFHLREIPNIKGQLEVLTGKVKSLESRVDLVGQKFEMGLQGIGDRFDTFNLRVDLVKGMLTQQGVAVRKGVTVLLDGSN